MRKEVNLFKYIISKVEYMLLMNPLIIKKFSLCYLLTLL